jgi:hypothetical protein
MVNPARPFDSLVSLAGAAASGELICSSPAGEVHVYLQCGRIAWATDSRHPFAFAAHLQDTAGIDVDTFRQVIEECRRDRLPLGETLVAWGLATWEVVRSALGHQISLALSLLATTETGQTLFLTRGYAAYDEHLTFAIEDFTRSVERRSADAEGAPKPVPTVTDTPHQQPSLPRRLRSGVEGLSWVEVYEHERLTDGDPWSPTPRLPARLIRETLLDGAEFAAVRSTRSSLIGLGLAQPRSLWCRISAESTFGAVVSAIWSIAGGVEKSSERPPPRPDATAWTIGETAAASQEAIRSFLSRAHDVLGAVVLGRDPAGDPVFGSGSSILEPEVALDIARRRASALTLDPLPGADDTERVLDSIGYSLKTMVSGEPKLWCFGSELDPECGETLWLFLDRRTSQGLGWAYLSAVTRALARARTEAAR